MTLLAASLGLEPRQRDPESLVLPLHHEARARGQDLKLNLHVAQADRKPTRSQLIQGHFRTLTSAFYLKIAFALGGQLSPRLNHLVDHFVVVRRVVMEKNELSNGGIDSERDGSAERAVAPAYVRLIFLVCVLGIENQNIGTLKKFHEFGAVFASALLRLLRAQQMRFSRVQLERFVRFMIRQKSDRAFAGENSIANADARMIHEF